MSPANAINRKMGNDAKAKRGAQGFAKKVAHIIGMSGGLACGRGSTGLFALFSGIRKVLGQGEVIVPSLCCEAVALAVRASGHELTLADISPDTLCMTPETLAPHIGKNTRAVIIVHSFGIDAKTWQFDILRKEFPNTIFVEDIAHAFGGHSSSGKMLGGQLDFGLTSLASNKILPGGLGLLLHGANPKVPLDIISKRLPNSNGSDVPPELCVSLRNIVHSVADLWRGSEGEKNNAIFPMIEKSYYDIITQTRLMPCMESAENALKNIEHITTQRHLEYLEWVNIMNDGPFHIPNISEGGTCWRVPVVFESPKVALAATRTLRKHGFPVSNHYFPLSVLYGQDSCPNAEMVALRIINLWTDGSITLNDKLKIAKLIKKQY